MCELLHKAAGLHLSLSLCLLHTLSFSFCQNVCVTVPEKAVAQILQKTSFLYFGDVQMGSLFAPAGSSTTFCKWLLCERARGNAIKHTANNWNGTFCESSLAVIWKEAVVWFEGARSQYKRQMNCLCFPFCLFKYWNTKSFRIEIMLRGCRANEILSTKTNSLKSSGVSGCVFVLQVQSLLGWFLWSSSRSERFNAGLMSNLKVHGGGAEV